MSDIGGNVWADEVNDDDNVWDENNVISDNDNSQSKKTCPSNDELDSKSQSEGENLDRTYLDSNVIWDDVKDHNNEKANSKNDENINIWYDKKNGNCDTEGDNSDIVNKISDTHPASVSKMDNLSNVNNIENYDNIENIEVSKCDNNDNNDSSDNDFDEFGDFEEIPKETLTFDKPLEELLMAIFSYDVKEEDYCDNNKDLKYIEKSSLLTNGGVKPMKCYNTITSENRQYLANKFLILNTRKRGCFEKTEIHKQASSIVGEWICDEKGIEKETTGKSKSSWKNIGKNNIFRWSSKIDDNNNLDTDNEKEKKDKIYNITERKLIGQKLLNASFEQSRKIIEERLENEKKKRMALEKIKWEREQMLKKEQQKKEEELNKYNIDSLETKETKKKGFFGKMFAGKSKIAKDHISHKKIQTEGDDDNQVVELSLKEQLELDGYNFSKSKRRNEKSKKEHLEGDDDDEEEDENDGIDITAYNMLDSKNDSNDLSNNINEENNTSDIFFTQPNEDNIDHNGDAIDFNNKERSLHKKEDDKIVKEDNIKENKEKLSNQNPIQDPTSIVDVITSKIKDNNNSNNGDNNSVDEFDDFQSAIIPSNDIKLKINNENLIDL